MIGIRPHNVAGCDAAQLEKYLGAHDNLDFTLEELSEIDRYAVGSGVDDPWRSSSDLPIGAEATTAG